MSEVKIQWHPGFAAAIDLEFAENREDLVYEKEYNLNTKPLEIDLLVIKKGRGVQISNEIGKIFRRYNILEYKSPKDSLDIDSFYKACAYACLYKAYGETTDSRKAQDITVSMVRDTRPDGLFSYFTENGIRMESPYRGIYYIQDGVLFPTQVVVTKELDKKAHIWLKALTDKMGKQDMGELLEKVSGIGQKFDRELAESVLEVSIRANRLLVEELRGDDSVCQALLEIMEPEINKIEVTAQVREEVTAQVTEEVTAQVTREVTLQVTGAVKADDILCAVKCFRDLGIEDSKVRELLVKNYGLSYEESEKYL